jgi:phosphotransferase system IIB component
VNLEKYSKGKNKNIMKVEYNSKQLKIDSYKSSKIDPEELEQLQEQMRCFDEIEFENRKN